MIDDEMIAWIDQASYEQLLRRWREATAGDPFFRGAIGARFQAAMRARRAEAGEAGHVRASKAIGWGGTS
jgi:hypothetical protein